MMISYYPQKLLAYFIPYFREAAPDSGRVADMTTAYEDTWLKLVVPESSLARGSVKLMYYDNTLPFTQWASADNEIAYSTLQKVVRLWETRGTAGYLIYGKETDQTPFSWEIIPYPQNGWCIWKQFKVLWNMVFGGISQTQAEREKIAQEIDLDSIDDVERTPVPLPDKKDAFCDAEVINRQRVFEGKEVDVLYNYAPIVIGEGKYDFLIVPKRHCPRFSDLTQDEYTETMELSQKLINIFREKGYHTAYLFDKTGVEAGQTVPHWHEHIVFTSTKTQEFFGRLKVLKNMLFGSSPLPPNELQARVETLRCELQNALQCEN